MALLADYANIAQGGKLNVLGIFKAIYSSAFPAVHPQMQLIFMWESSRAESGRTKRIEIELCDADGKKMGSLGADFKVPEGTPGKKIQGSQIIGFNNVAFPKSGEYVFNIIINEELKESASFEVLSLPKEAKHE
jgi:hypothetical protein